MLTIYDPTMNPEISNAASGIGKDSACKMKQMGLLSTMSQVFFLLNRGNQTAVRSESEDHQDTLGVALF